MRKFVLSTVLIFSLAIGAVAGNIPMLANEQKVVSAKYPTPAGLVRSAWKYKGDKWMWKFTVPKGAVATVTLPGESDSKKYAPGTYKIEILIK